MGTFARVVAVQVINLAEITSVHESVPERLDVTVEEETCLC
jgi:hypothetical protein